MLACRRGRIQQFGRMFTCWGSNDVLAGLAGEAELSRHGHRVLAERAIGLCVLSLRAGDVALIPREQSICVNNQRASVSTKLVREWRVM